MSESRQARNAALLAVALALVLVAATAAAAPPLSPFTLFGWVSPPVEYTTPAQYDDMARIGFDLVLPTQDDEGHPADNLARLDLVAARGMRALVYDARLVNAYYAGITTPQAGAILDSVVATYRNHPGFLGYYLGDEPRGAWVDTIAIFHEELRKRDPAHITWNNLAGESSFANDSLFRDAVSHYLDVIPASVLSDAHYDFVVTGIRDRFFENVTSMRSLADAHHLPFWIIVQLVPHLVFRPITEGELRWQVSQVLAFGAQGVGYFTYWTPKPDTVNHWGPAVIARDGSHTPWFDVLASFDARVRPAGTQLAGMRWISAQATAPCPKDVPPFAGDDWLAGVDGRVTVGRFVAPDGTPWLLVANRDSLASQRVSLSLRGATGTTRVDGGTPASNTSDLGAVFSNVEIEPGDFALLRIEGTRGEAHETLGPLMGTFANPVRGSVRVALDRIGGAARCDVLDALGRRVWTSPLAAGVTEVTWDGRDQRGARAAPGVYVMRVHDTRGSADRRLVWLGR